MLCAGCVYLYLFLNAVFISFSLCIFADYAFVMSNGFPSVCVVLSKWIMWIHVKLLLTIMAVSTYFSGLTATLECYPISYLVFI